ncbi:3-hydroxyanthranilate 3,4-dioxygenase [Acrasis kona]|uniref:3-hydroxyanthranilate 3,4-dioxygenase n=1 Tax=Acrasis kona TaxID=1008807 RepID=A0AAW2ZED8_9EUKA
MTEVPKVHDFWKWVEEHKQKLQPPVGNALMYNGELKVQVISGPNQRTDFHVEEHEEYFHQLKGDMVLRIVDPTVVDRVEFKDIVIKEGEMFCLPARIPHSPQRVADTLGLVIELERNESDVDYLRWYCDNDKCREIVYQEGFHCKDLGKQLKPVIEGYYQSDEKRTCKKCGHKNIITNK